MGIDFIGAIEDFVIDVDFTIEVFIRHKGVSAVAIVDKLTVITAVRDIRDRQRIAFHITCIGKQIVRAKRNAHIFISRQHNRTRDNWRIVYCFEVDVDDVVVSEFTICNLVTKLNLTVEVLIWCDCPCTIAVVG